MKYILTTLAIFYSGITFSQEKHEVQLGNIRCIYSTSMGRINGHYVSYYANGKKRAEGNFKNQQRDSTWILWDSLGNQVTKRFYTSPLSFSMLPERDSLTQNKNEFDGAYQNHRRRIDYPALKAENVLWSKRIWRFIPHTKLNAFMFHDNRLNKCIFSAVRQGALTVYNGNDDQFAHLFEGLNLDTSSMPIGYRIKEDWYFDKSRSVMDVQIVGLAPVIRQASTKDSVNLCWVYFPDLKPLLYRFNLSDNPLAPNRAELFQERMFTSVIYKESNVYNREMADYLPLRARNAEAEKIELEMIENEHNLWTSK